MATIFKRYSDAAASVQRERNTRANQAFSISRLISAMTGDSPALDGYEREVAQEVSIAMRGYYDPQRVVLPIELLSDPTIRPDALVRDMSAGSASAGGYLVGSTISPINDLMKPWSSVIRAGATVINGDMKRVGTGSIIIPKTSKDMVGYWLNGEGAALTESDPEVDKVTLTPKTCGALTKFSMLMAKQGNVADALLQKHMLSIVGGLLDSAAVSGTGTNGQPKGITNTSGVAAATGPGINQSVAVVAEYNATIAGGSDSFGFLTHPVIRASLRIPATGTYPFGPDLLTVWKSGKDGDRFIDWPAYVTDKCPSDVMVAGPWQDCVIAMWGAPVIEINPYDANDFKKGIIGARILLDCDVAIVHPGAWMKITEINNTTDIVVL